MYREILLSHHSIPTTLLSGTEFHSTSTQGRSILDQVLYLSQSILNGFNKPEPGSRAILSTTKFSKALTRKASRSFPQTLFKLAQRFASFDGLKSYFLTSALAWFIKITKVVPFESVEVFHKDPFLALFFSLFINDIPTSLPSSVSCFPYADDLAI